VAAAILAATVVIAGCSGLSGSRCIPGATQACIGPGGCLSGQSCRADGEGYDPCSCGPGSPADAAGNSAGDSTVADAAGDSVVDSTVADAAGNSGGDSTVTDAAGDSGLDGAAADAAGDSGAHDFSSIPLMDPNGMPAGNPASIFGPAGSGTTTGGPCLVEPADGSLVPKNWLRPRIVWSPGAGQNLFEVRIESTGEANPLVVYTTKNYWTMDASIWQAIAYTPPTSPGGTSKDGSLVGIPVKVTIRGSNGGGTPAISNSASFTIAPVVAAGTLVYSSTSSFAQIDMNTNTSTTLQGFTVGDEGTTTALTVSQVQQPVRAQSVDGGNLAPASFNGVSCIGCHSATPDGNYVSFTTQFPWATALASVQAGQAGQAPPWLTQGAISNLSPNINGYYQPANLDQVTMGIQTFSPAHYKTGDRRLVASIGAAWNQTEAQILAGSPGTPTGVVSELAWFDLETTAPPPAGAPYNPWGSGKTDSPLPLAPRCNAGPTVTAPAGQPGPCATTVAPTPGWGIVARTGDANSAGAPSWSHDADGNTDVIAYSSTNLGTKEGRMDCELSGSTCTSDVYLVQYNNGAGGQAVPLGGAALPDQSEYYPAFSPDDQLIAFNRVPTGTSMYNAPKADVYVVPYNNSAGGTATRLVANDPVSCTGEVSGAVQNTWPKWAPDPVDGNGNPIVQTVNGNTYYWITFSSTRSPQAPRDPGNGNKRKQQLYVAGVVVAADKSIKTFAPVYVWNQDFNVNNLIPAWGEFQLPGVTTPPPAPGLF
jgi:hypothetical protein